MELIQIHKKGQLTLPRDVRQRLGLEDGDFFEVEVVDDTIVLHPKKLVEASQAYFWAEEWQKAERQASADILAGRVGRFASAKDAIVQLHEEARRRSGDE